MEKKTYPDLLSTPATVARLLVEGVIEGVSASSSVLLFFPSSSSLVLLDAELEEAVVLRSMVPLL